jgi:hypothetical protein
MEKIMEKTNAWLSFISILACALLLVASLPARSTQADRPSWFVPTPTPIPPSVSGAIELIVESTPPGLWTVVQWQDALGGWHDVEGWQGVLDESNIKTWWVDRADFGQGPFRWAVAWGGELLATSELFYLPRSAGEVVRVQVTLEP